MKGLFCFITALFCFGSLCAQAPPIQWQRSFGGSKADVISAVEQTKDGGYIACGYSNSSDGDVKLNRGGSDGLLIKLDQSGIPLWNKTYGGSLEDGFSSVRQTKDGGFILAGSSESKDGDLIKNQGKYDSWIARVDSSGMLIWSKTYGGSERDYVNCIRETPDGGFIVSGTAYSNDGDVSANVGWQNYWTLKLYPDGEIEWKKNYGGSKGEGGYSIEICKDGGYIMTGYSSSDDGDVSESFGESDLWVVKIDKTGALEWQKSFGAEAYESGNSIQQTSDGGYIIAGERYIMEDGNWDYWILKINAKGVVEWDKLMGGTGSDHAFSVTQTKDKGYIVAGVVGSKNRDINDNKGMLDAWIVKLSEKGTLEWERCFGGSSMDQITCIKQTKDEGFIMSGTSQSSDGDLTNNQGDYDGWVVKLLPEAMLISGPRELCKKQTATFLTNKFPLELKWFVDSTFVEVNDSLIYTFKKPGNYVITASCDTPGIHFKDTFTISIIAEPAGNLPQVLSACEPMKETICPNLNQQNISLLWSDGNTDSCRTFENSGLYTVKLSNPYCSTFDTIQVIEKEIPKFNIHQVDTPCMDGTAFTELFIVPDTFPFVQWQTGANGNSRFINYTSDVKYINVTGSNGCTIDKSFDPINGCNMTWYLPNSFTPNNDGLNDVLSVSGTMIIASYMEVYNRWGQLLFKSDDALVGWDGRYRGNIVPEGNYYVRIGLQSDENSMGERPVVYSVATVLLTR